MATAQALSDVAGALEVTLQRPIATPLDPRASLTDAPFGLDSVDVLVFLVELSDRTGTEVSLEMFDPDAPITIDAIVALLGRSAS